MRSLKRHIGWICMRLNLRGFFACQFENSYGPAFSRTLTPPPPPQLQEFLDPAFVMPFVTEKSNKITGVKYCIVTQKSNVVSIISLWAFYGSTTASQYGPLRTSWPCLVSAGQASLSSRPFLCVYIKYSD